MAKIIVVEGPDRVGKQTQTHLLKEYIESLGFRATIVEVPIRGGLTYHVIYWMLKNGLAKKLPKLFQWFQYLNRKIFEKLRLPKLEQINDFIILDRWSLSTVVYGMAEGLTENFTTSLMKKLRIPNHTIILAGKSYLQEAEDAYESDSDLQRKVTTGYVRWFEKNQDQTTLIDCRLSREEVAKKIQEILQEKDLIPKW